MHTELNKEQTDIVKAAREFAEGEFPDVAMEYDKKEEFPRDLWKKACELGFIGLYLPEEYDGGGFGLFEQAILMEEFWRVDPGCGCILITAFGSKMIELYGDEAQKRKYLPPLSKGEAIMGAAITEPDAGSDVFGIGSTARREGKDYVINGSKMFISNGTIADFLAVFVLTNPEGGPRTSRHSVIMVETDRAGVEATKITGKMGIRASDTAEVRFNDVRVPGPNLLGKEGEGFEQVMQLFNFGRVEGAAQGVGVAQGALEKAIKHVKQRAAFGRSVASFQAVRFEIAEMATRIEAARSLYQRCARLYDGGQVDPKLIAMAKWFAGEIGVRVTDQALQLHGGYGYIADYDVERFYRDAKIVEIYEGTKQIEKNTIANVILGKS